MLAPGLHGDVLGGRLHGAGVDGGGDRGVEVDHHRGLQRVVALETGQLDDLLHEPREPVALGEHPGREALDRLRVVGGVRDGLCEQPDRAHRRLQLVADVGHEVAAHGLDPPLAGAVLDEGQHQPGAQRRDARGQRAGGAAVGGRQVELALADLPVASDLGDHVEQLRHDQGVAAHQPEGVRRRGGLEDVVGRVDDDRAGAQDAEHGGDTGLHDRLLHRRHGVPLAVADVPREHCATCHDGPDDRGQPGLHRRIHALIVRIGHPRPDRMDAELRVFMRRSPGTHICSLRLPTVPACVRLSMTSSTASSPTCPRSAGRSRSPYERPPRH
ncbi:hypothetical protein NOCA1240377 [metagenome]|uniref:Uncharacterized protein n=1 Tax=metagenome TaxID=256318 RepID=A0A2P2CH03_9ZZZZ